MSDSIDKLLDLLLDLEPPNNNSNSNAKSASKKQKTPLAKSKPKFSQSQQETIAPQTRYGKKIKQNKNQTFESKIVSPLIESQETTEITEVRSALVEIPDNPLEAISSSISKIKNPTTKHNGKLAINSSEIFIEDWVAQKEIQLNELADSLNNLIPLIVELLSDKTDNSQEVVLRTMIPIIDKVIEERSRQDLEKMSLAMARILPNAITQEMKIQPQSVGKAIAPELALSIEEQIRLDEDAISLALASEMGKAIKAQIELERDVMVDALYPVIGNTISKYMAEEIARINEKMEQSLSIKGILRKFRAKIRGVSEAELILQESMICEVRAIFLIQKDSGLVICEVQPDREHPLESDLLAGMLTAIRSFANDCIVSGSELSEIDYGNFQILLEAAGYCYIAVVTNGQPKPEFRDRIRDTLSKIVVQYGDFIEHYDGDTSTVPAPIKLLLRNLLKNLTAIGTGEDGTSEENKKKSPPILLWLLAFLLTSILLPWGIFKYRAVKAQRITQEISSQLESNPQLAVYRLKPQVARKEITIAGKVPSEHLRNLATEIVTEIAEEKELNLNNQILTVDIRPDSAITSQEVTRVSNLLNQLPGVAIASELQDYRVKITGFITEKAPNETVTSAFSHIPGVEQVVFSTKKVLPGLGTRIYFGYQKSEFDKSADASKLESIKQFLEKSPTLNLKIIGHSDRIGSKSHNQKLILERANNVYQELIAIGVDPNRLKILTSEQFPPDVTPGQPLWLSRCVRFEPFIPE